MARLRSLTKTITITVTEVNSAPTLSGVGGGHHP
jgi:hypothetical protein